MNIIQRVSLIIVVIAWTGCSKEKQFEKSLYQNEDKWNIVSSSWNYYSNTDSILIDTSAHSLLPGYFTFKKDNKGYFTFDFLGEPYGGEFAWSTDNEDIFIYNKNVTKDANYIPDWTTTSIYYGGRNDDIYINLDGSTTRTYPSEEKYIITVHFTLEKE